MITKVDKYPINSFGYRITLGGRVHELSNDEAEELFGALAEALNKRSVTVKGCGDRMSHGPHHWGRNDLCYCTGRSFDST